MQERFPADEVQILIRPAAMIVDERKGQVSLTNRYYVVLLDRADQELRVSPEYYPWDRAMQLAGIFHGKDAKKALEWWERKFGRDDAVASGATEWLTILELGTEREAEEQFHRWQVENEQWSESLADDDIRIDVIRDDAGKTVYRYRVRRPPRPREG